MSEAELLAIITAQGNRLNELETLKDAYLIQKRESEDSNLSLGERVYAGHEMTKLAEKMVEAILNWE